MADTPFGLGFGSPSRYMGSSGIQEAGNDLKKFAVAKLVDTSGTKDWLNKTFGKSPSGSVPPISSGAAGDKMTNGVWGDNPLPVAPPSFASQNPMMPAAPAGSVSPMTDELGTPIPQMGTMTQPMDTGSHLNDAMKAFNVSAFTNPTAQHDVAVNPNENYGYTQQLSSGNAYQQVPGYGKLQKAAQMAAGFLG